MDTLQKNTKLYSIEIYHTTLFPEGRRLQGHYTCGARKRWNTRQVFRFFFYVRVRGGAARSGGLVAGGRTGVTRQVRPRETSRLESKRNHKNHELSYQISLQETTSTDVIIDSI